MVGLHSTIFRKRPQTDDVDGNLTVTCNSGGDTFPAINGWGPTLDSVGVHSLEETAALMNMMNLPLKRLGTPQDIGAAVVFMASSASSWITGQCLYVDGGM